MSLVRRVSAILSAAATLTAAMLVAGIVGGEAATAANAMAARQRWWRVLKEAGGTAGGMGQS